MDKRTAIVNSALWAAYADALGFISELTNESGLKHRLGREPFDTTRPWKRKIGGPYGATVDLPAGCYSDDTQLRLATTRCIRGTGAFDVELFAKIELPVWLSYDLGAGPTTKAGAASLRNRTVNWFSNFFVKSGFRGINYINGGGNGAAMRIQPHVWAAHSLDKPETFLGDVVRNSICTHGHPRAILGSVFHAMCLAHVLRYREIPHPSLWRTLMVDPGTIRDLVSSDNDLATFWLPAWEKQSDRSFRDSWKETVQELIGDIDTIRENVDTHGRKGYEESVKSIDALSEEWRGTGTKTALLALALCWHFRDENIDTALLDAARLLGSDTDTIGTLAGALLGVLQNEEPKGYVLDREYIKQETFRLASISEGERTESFRYPDVLVWKAPKSSLDNVGLVDGKPALAGLGYLQFDGRTYNASGKDGNVWAWAMLDFGQSVLCARRAQLEALPVANAPASQGVRSIFEQTQDIDYKRPTYAKRDLRPYPPMSKSRTSNVPVPDLFDSHSNRASTVQQKSEEPSIDKLTDEAIKSGFDPIKMGKHLRLILEEDSTMNLAIGYAAIVSKAWCVRHRKDEK